MPEVTFRDFAGAVMANDETKASQVLAVLLQLDEAQASRAAAHFLGQMTAAGPAFMGKAMGLRAAVESGGDDDIRALLADCFGLEGDAAAVALAALRARYPRSV